MNNNQFTAEEIKNIAILISKASITGAEAPIVTNLLIKIKQIGDIFSTPQKEENISEENTEEGK